MGITEYMHTPLSNVRMRGVLVGVRTPTFFVSPSPMRIPRSVVRLCLSADLSCFPALH